MSFIEELEALLNKHKVTIEPCPCMFNCGIIIIIPVDTPIKISMKSDFEFITTSKT